METNKKAEQPVATAASLLMPATVSYEYNKRLYKTIANVIEEHGEKELFEIKEPEDVEAFGLFEITVNIERKSILQFIFDKGLKPVSQGKHKYIDAQFTDGSSVVMFSADDIIKMYEQENQIK